MGGRSEIRIHHNSKLASRRRHYRDAQFATLVRGACRRPKMWVCNLALPFLSANHSSSRGAVAGLHPYFAGVKVCGTNDDKIGHPGPRPFKHDNVFYRVREGDLFLDTFDRRGKRDIKRSDSDVAQRIICALMVIKAIAAKYAGYGRSQPLLVRRGK